MRNDTMRWAAASEADRPSVGNDDARISIYRPQRQTLVSGPYSAALNRTRMGAAVGWPEDASGAAYAVRLRRDRILVINGSAVVDGWHSDGGLAVSEMTFAYAIIDLDGPKSLDILRQGTELTLSPSASVAREFSGFGIFLYSRGINSFRLHVRRSHLEAIWSLLENYLGHADGR